MPLIVITRQPKFQRLWALMYRLNASSLTCDAAVTSCLGSQLASPGNCWNCGGAFSSDYQCDVSPVKPESVKLASSLNLPPDLKISKQRPSPSAPVVLKKPVRMLDGSPAFPPRQKGKNSWTVGMISFCEICAEFFPLQWGFLLLVFSTFLEPNVSCCTTTNII